MKFESKFGIGEVVGNNIRKGGKLISSELYEVISIVFDASSSVIYCRNASSGIVVPFKEHELSGDADYSQEQGGYIETTT